MKTKNDRRLARDKKRRGIALIVVLGMLTALVMIALGFATFLLGLIVVIPWLAYATWHGYREALDVTDWPVLPTRQRHSAAGEKDAAD